MIDRQPRQRRIRAGLADDRASRGHEVLGALGTDVVTIVQWPRACVSGVKFAGAVKATG